MESIITINILSFNINDANKPHRKLKFIFYLQTAMTAHYREVLKQRERYAKKISRRPKPEQRSVI